LFNLYHYFGFTYFSQNKILKLMTALYRFLCIFCLLGFSSLENAALAQNAISSVFQSLTGKEGTKIAIEMDLTALIGNKKTVAYSPAKLTGEDGKIWEIEVRPRGKYRRKICQLPPLKLKFKKKSLTAAGLDTLNEMKLVLPCFEDEHGDELIIKEYLAYRMFELMTDACVKARLIKLSLTDTHIGKKHTVFAILLEDEEEICKRLKGIPSETYGIPADSLLTNQAALVSMFEYMVGNTDWDLSMIRNVRTIRSPESGKIILIPYDFDFSGLVSAPYATPSSESGLRNVRERFLISNGLPPESLRRATQRMKGYKKDILALCRSKYLSREGTQDMTAYLESFFLKAESVHDMPSTMKAPATE
jgi:hypothetical protein